MKTSYLAVLALGFIGTIAFAAQPAGKKSGTVPRLKVSTADKDRQADADDAPAQTQRKPAKKSAGPGPGLKLSTDGKKTVDEAEVVKNLSFMLGFGVGKQIAQFRDLDVEIDRDVLQQALNDAAEGKESGMSEEESQAAAAQIHQFVQAKYAVKNKRDGEEFLANNKKKEGVKTLASGLQYKIIEKGEGKSPKKTDVVRAHYKGTFTNGMEFESSYQSGQPASFPVDKVIKGWTEALQLMKVGGKWRLFIPSDLAYGENGMRDRQGNERIPPNATLVFEVELLGIEKGPNGPALK